MSNKSTECIKAEGKRVEQRVRTWLSKEDAMEIRRLRLHFKFPSDHQLFKSSILTTLRLLQEAERRQRNPKDTSIRDAFREMSEYQAVEFGCKDKRRRKGKEGKLAQAVIRALFDGQFGVLVDDAPDEECRPTPPPDVPRWYSRFVNAHYDALYHKYAERAEKLTAYTLAPRDLLHDTLLSLQDPPPHITSYELYERWALAKFNESSRANHHEPEEDDHHADYPDYEYETPD